MDYIYSQLPEVVYDPADLTYVPPKNASDETVRLNINNKKRTISADVIKTPHKLTLIDKNNPGVVLEFNGSSDVQFEIPKFDGDFKVEYKLCTQAGVPHIPNSEKQLVEGDGYLEITTMTGTKTYVPLTLQAKKGGIQKIRSLNRYYDVYSINEIPEHGAFPVRLVDASGIPYIGLYERLHKLQDGHFLPELVCKVSADDIYAIEDTGLLGVLDTSQSPLVIVELRSELDKKQDRLVFDKPYNAETNKVVTEDTVRELDTLLVGGLTHVNEQISTIQTKVDTVEESVDANSKSIESYDEILQNFAHEISTFAKTVDDFTIRDIKIIDNKLNPEYYDFVVETSGKDFICPLKVAPKGDKGDTGPGIQTIEPISKDGRITTFQITYTDGRTPTVFTILDGEKGAKGDPGRDGQNGLDGAPGAPGQDGKNGEDGKTPEITEDGYWKIGDEVTNYKAIGQQGEQGVPGEQGPAGYPVQIKKVYNSPEAMKQDQNLATNGDMYLVNDTSSKLFLFYNSDYIQIVDFKQLTVPSDVVIDEVGRLRLKSGNSLLGNGIEFPATGATRLSATLSEDKTKVSLQLYDNKGNALMDEPVIIPAGSGTGTDGPVQGSDTVVINSMTNTWTYTLVKGSKEPVYLEYYFKVFSEGDARPIPVDVEYQLSQNNSAYRTMAKFELGGNYATLQDDAKIPVSLDLISGTTTVGGVKINTFSIDNFLAYDVNNTSIKIIVRTKDGSQSASITRYLTPVSFYIIPDTSFKYTTPYNRTSSISFFYSVQGRNLDKMVYGKVYNSSGVQIGSTYESAWGPNEGDISGTTRSFTIPTSDWEQGVYKIVLECVANGTIHASPVTFTIMYTTGDENKNQYLFGNNFSYNLLTYGDVVRYTYSAVTVGEDSTVQLTTDVYGYDADTNKRTDAPLESFYDYDMTPEDVRQRAINVGTSTYYKYVDPNNEFNKNKTYDKLIFVMSSGTTSVEYEVEFQELVTIYDVNIYRGTSFIAQVAPRGQTNDESNATALSTSYMMAGKEIPVPVVMEQFNFVSNGYITTQSGDNFVRLSGDARLKIGLPIFENAYQYEVEQPDGTLKTEEVRFDNTTNSKGRTVEFRFKVSNSVDNTVPIVSYIAESTFENDQGELVPRKYGFRILPREAYLVRGASPNYDSLGMTTNSHEVALTNFCEDEIIRLTFMLDPTVQIGDTYKRALKIYLNGELARIVATDSCDYTNQNLPQYITIGSNSAQVDLYSVTFYQEALTDARVLQNYFADTTYISDRIRLYTENDLANSEGTRAGYTPGQSYDPKTAPVNYDFMLDYDKCKNRLPCILLKGDIPGYKGDKKKVGVIITKPDGNGSYTEVVRSIDTKTKDGATTYINDIDVQGTTSAKEYPRYNFKIKLNSYFEAIEKDTGDVDGDGKPVTELKATGAPITDLNKFTEENPDKLTTVSKLKVYLTKEHKISLEDKTGREPKESTLCWKADMMSPDHANTVNGLWFDDLFPSIPTKVDGGMNYHPTVWGFRCLLFQEVQVGNNTMYTFLGDGCLNNDKGNSNTFGLENKNDDGQYTTCQKWEYADNGLDLTEFKTDRFFEKVIVKENQPDGSIKETEIDAVLEAFESTYPDQGDLEDEDLSPDYSHLQLMYTWVVKRANFWNHREPENNRTIAVTYNGVSYDNEYDYKRAIFANEFTKHFNLDHTTSYYIAIQITGLVDNHAKNMFMTTYNTSDDIIEFTPEGEELFGITDDDSMQAALDKMISYLRQNPSTNLEDYINWEASSFCKWYPTAYDLDSCYGVDNKGYRVFPYTADIDSRRYNDPDSAYLVNGAESVFWRMFKDVFYSAIVERYRDLTKTTINYGDNKSVQALSYDNWKRYMIDNNIDTVPPRVTSEDSIFKYVMPWWFGYKKDTLYEPDGSKLYLVKSNRRLDDMDFMKRRIALYSSLYAAGEFSQDATGLLLNSVANITSADKFIKLKYDQELTGRVKWNTNTAAVGADSIDAEGCQNFNVPVGQFGGDKQSMYLLGQGHITEIRDLYHIQPSKFAQVNAPNLRRLEIGNYQVRSENKDLTTTLLSISGCDMLEYLDVSYCTNVSFDSLDLSKATMLKTLHAEGCSNLAEVSLPDGGYLQYVYLPSVQTLMIRNQPRLETVSLESTSNIKTINIKGNTGNLDVVALLLARTNASGKTQLTGLRLEDVELDISDNPNWRQFINLLTSDEFLKLRISADNDSLYVAEDTSTHYPIIEGSINIGHWDEIRQDAELDRQITRIVKRYSKLTIVPPPADYTLENPESSGARPFSICTWTEIAAVCGAAAKGTLVDRFGPCGIEYVREEIDGSTRYRGWWSLSDYKAVRLTIYDSKTNTTSTEDVDLQIYGFNNEKLRDGSYIPVQLLVKRALGYNTPYYRQHAHICDIKLTCFDKHGQVVGEPQYYTSSNLKTEWHADNYQYTGASFQNTTGDVVTVEIEALNRTYLSFIEYNDTDRYYVSNMKNPLNTYQPQVSDDPNHYFLAQETLGGPSGADEQYCYTPAPGVYDSWPNLTRPLVVDTTQGSVNVYNTRLLITNQQVRGFEMLPKSKLRLSNIGNTHKLRIIIPQTSHIGGYWSSELRNFIENTYITYLPEECVNIIKPAFINSTDGPLTTEVVSGTAYIYPPTFSQLGGSEATMSPYVEEAGGVDRQLDYITTNAQRSIRNSSGDFVTWWQRSLSPYDYAAMETTNGGGFYVRDVTASGKYVVVMMNI